MLKYKNEIMAITVGATIAWFVCWRMDVATLKRGMPPGYALEADQHGHYRPINSEFGFPLRWSRGYGSKASAMRRAWEQYEFVMPPKGHDFTREKVEP